MSSLRRRLLASLALTVIVVNSAAMLALYFNSRRDLDRLFDTQLSQTAHLTLALVVSEGGTRHGKAELRPRVIRVVHALRQQYHRELAFQIISTGGRVLKRTPNAPSHPFTRVQAGFSDVRVDRVNWRVYSLSTPDDVRMVQVAGEKEQRKSAATAVSAHVLWFLPLYLLPLALLIWLSVHRSLKPLSAISALVSQRDAHDLTPIDKKEAPREIGAVIDALNGLLAKLKAAMEREQDFMAHAAHELRTPLAALRLQAETAHAASDHSVRRHALRQIVAIVAQCSHLIGQLLTLARIDSIAFRPTLRPLDLYRLCQDALAEIAPAALDKDIDLSLQDVENPIRITGDHDTLMLLMRNLGDNAIQQTPPGGAVVVNLRSSAGGAVLEISDTGPGIPAEKRERVFERFWRDNGSEATGSGLGLSIVKRIADIHHATVEFAEPLHGQQGARVFVRFPL